MFNNKTKMFLLLTLMFVAVVGLSAATAAEIDNTAADSSSAIESTIENVDDTANSAVDVSTKNTQITKKTIENVKGDGENTTTANDEATITDLATDIAESEVTLTKDYTQASGETSITISEDKTVDGAGHTITTTNGLFTVAQNVTFTLKNSIIVSPTYGASTSNSVDVIIDKGNLVLNNVTFIYANEAKTFGSPVYMNTGSTVKATDCVFDGAYTNRAAIYGYGSEVNIDVDGCTFKNIKANNGAIHLRTVDSNVTVKNSLFQDNTEANYGAGLYLNNYRQVALIENCTFINNSASTRGVIYTSGNLTLKDSTFKDNKQSGTATQYFAGAIWVNQAQSRVYLENNVMDDPDVPAAEIYFNNGVLESDMTITTEEENIVADEEAPVQIVYNVCDDNGNTIVFRTGSFTVKVNDEAVTSTASNGQIVAEFDASYEPGTYPVTITYDESKVLGNVEVSDVNLTVKDIGLIKYNKVTEMANKAKKNSEVVFDGPIFRGASEDSIVIDNYVTLNFNGNTINAKQGKVFDIVDGAVVTIKNAVITNVGTPSPNVYNTEGRIANVTGGFVTFENVTFKDNKAPNYGSSAKGSFILALFDDSYVELKDCTITNCSGSFINNVNSTVKIDATTFENNNLYLGYSESWEALIANGGILDISDSAFINNTPGISTIRGQDNTLAYSAYGGYYTLTNQPMTITNTLFKDNYASNGRGAAINTNNDTTITNSVFINNRQNSYSNEGGAIYSEDGLLDIDNCVFINNSARYSVSTYSSTVTANEGTAIYNRQGDMNIRNSIIVSNVTGKSSIYNGAKDAKIVANGNFWGNETPEGFYKSLSSADPITVENWVVPVVTVDGEVKYNEESNVTFTLKTTDGTTESDLTETFPEYGDVAFSIYGGTIADESVEVADASATTSFVPSYKTTEITATYLGMDVVYNANVTMPTPEEITLNDANWTTYFNETTGELNTDLITIPDTVLKFEGTFNGRDMIITFPVVITTADEQAVLNNCTITIAPEAHDVTIKNIEMNAVDYTDSLINVDDVVNVNIENNKLTITNNDEKQLTRAIEVVDGENVVIKDNEINTIGPEENIVYVGKGGDVIGTLYTTSIKVNGTKGVVIDSNKINTKNNAKEEEALSGTIYGVYVHGARGDLITDAQIINNEITTEGNVYAYGLTVNDADSALVDNNTLVTTGNGDYADGLQLGSCSNSVVSNNTVTITTNGYGYGILNNGMLDWGEYEEYPNEANFISNNVVDIKAKYAQGIQVFYGESNAVTYNNITITDCDSAVGIGSADASYGDISYNNINIKAKVGVGGEGDAIKFDTTGIKIQQSSLALHSASYNAVAFNHVIVDSPLSTTPAVNTTMRAEITNNYLVSPKGVGDKAVLNTASWGTTIEDNTPLVYKLTDSTYSTYFDENGTFIKDSVEEGSFLEASGVFYGKNFTFDDAEVTIISDGTATFTNATIITQNGAKVTLDGITVYTVIDVNTEVGENETVIGPDYVVLLESEGNTIKNSRIIVQSNYPLHAVDITGDSNTIRNTTLIVEAPSADVAYDKNWVGHPAATGLAISSSNNLVEDSVVFYDGSEKSGYYPSADGIDVQSPENGIVIENNIIRNTGVIAKGPNYVYGITVGRAKGTVIEGVLVNATSDYYADAIELFDGDTTTITDSQLNATAGYQAYAIYSTGMGNGISQNTVVKNTEMNVEAPNPMAVLVEGSNATEITDSVMNVKGENAAAVNAYVDWMGNCPAGFTVDNCEINVEAEAYKPVMYFGKCSDVTITNNKIKAVNGAEIFVNATSNAKVTDNYIMINDTLVGDYGVITSEEDTVIENNTPVSKIIEELVGPQNTTIVINPIDDVKFNEQIKITGKLVDSKGNLIPDQEITITFNGKEAKVTTVDGVFTYETVAKALGTNNITATFTETDDYKASEANTTFETSIQTTIMTIDEIAETAYKNNVTITGTYTDANGSPIRSTTVKLNINGQTVSVKTDKNGVFTYTMTANTTGVNNVTASFAGNAKFEGATAEATFEVTKLGTVLTIDEISQAAYGDVVTITGTYKDANGNPLRSTTVKLNINGKTVSVKTDKNGAFTYDLKVNAMGINNITASFAGNAKFEGANATATFNVVKQSTVITIDPIADAVKGERVNITGTYKDANGNAIKSTTVAVYIDGVKHATKTDANGVFTYSVKANKVGTGHVTVSFAGNAKFEGAIADAKYTITA